MNDIYDFSIMRCQFMPLYEDLFKQCCMLIYDLFIHNQYVLKYERLQNLKYGYWFSLKKKKEICILQYFSPLSHAWHIYILYLHRYLCCMFMDLLTVGFLSGPLHLGFLCFFISLLFIFGLMLIDNFPSSLLYMGFLDSRFL